MTLPPPLASVSRRVLVTGLGMVSPLAIGAIPSWEAMLTGKVATRSAKSEFEDCPSQVVARVMGFDPAVHLPVGVDSQKMHPFTLYAVAAAKEAMVDARWQPSSLEEQLVSGVCIGTGIGDLDDIVHVANLISRGEKRKTSPFFIPKVLGNMAAGQVSIVYGLKGPLHCSVTACATAAHSIGDAFRLIKHGHADVMLAGGAESCINTVSMTGFSKMRALATKFNDNPEKASRPFDSQREGFVMGEGAGVLVLEEAEHAIARNAPIYGEIRGFGSSGDAFHISASDEEGDGARRAMLAALRESGLLPSHVGSVNAHATSTPKGDAAEAIAIQRVFGDHVANMSVTSNKGAIGHLLGAAGAVEAIFSILSLKHGVVPVTANCEDPNVLDSISRIIVRGNSPREQQLNAIISNSFGFGGVNASLIFSKWQ